MEKENKDSLNQAAIDIAKDFASMPKAAELLRHPTEEKAIELFGKDQVAPAMFACKSCGKHATLDKLKVFDTPVVKGAMAYLCDECWETARKAKSCYIICVKCKEVRKCMEPFVNPKNGFKLEAGKFYHIMDCPECNPDKYAGKTVPAMIIEEVLYDDKLKARMLSGQKAE